MSPPACQLTVTDCSGSGSCKALLPLQTALLLQAVASGLAQWHLDSRYHGATGSMTVPRDGGFSRQCPSSGRSVYPRIDPAIITLVTAGEDWCLLGRKKGWPRGRSVSQQRLWVYHCPAPVVPREVWLIMRVEEEADMLAHARTLCSSKSVLQPCLQQVTGIVCWMYRAGIR